MKWFKCALIRAIKSTAQMGVIALGGYVTIGEVEWYHVLGTMGLAFLLSFLTSLGGLPEVDKGNENGVTGS